MDFQYIMTAKKNFDSLLTLCEVIDNNGLWDKRGQDLSLINIFRGDIARFMLYLSASDGNLSPEEAQAFRTITGFTDSVDALIQLIRDHNLYSTAFESTVPMSVKIVTEAERNLLAMGAKLHPDTTVQALFIDFFESVGGIMLGSDDGVTENEQRDLGIYMNTLRQYMHQNSNDMG